MVLTSREADQAFSLMIKCKIHFSNLGTQIPFRIIKDFSLRIETVKIQLVCLLKQRVVNWVKNWHLGASLSFSFYIDEKWSLGISILEKKLSEFHYTKPLQWFITEIYKIENSLQFYERILKISNLHITNGHQGHHDILMNILIQCIDPIQLTLSTRC